MLSVGAQQLAAYCQRTVGDHLRSISIYRPDGVKRVFQREGLREAYTDEQVTALVQAASELNAVLHETDIEEAPLGEPRAGVYSFSDAFVVQLPYTEESGVVVTMDADAGTGLGGFLSECRYHLHSAGEGESG